MTSRPGLREYVERRLGRGATTQLRNVVLRPLGASSFSEFWRYWNPVYGYFLSYYAYRPLRRVFPRPLAVLLTFVGCGFLLHDLVGWAWSGQASFPEMTAIFALFGIGVVLSDALRVDLARYPFAVRALANAGCIAASVAIVHVLAPSGAFKPSGGSRPGVAGTHPMWLADGRIVFAHSARSAPLPRWYLIRADGTGVRSLPWPLTEAG